MDPFEGYPGWQFDGGSLARLLAKIHLACDEMQVEQADTTVRWIQGSNHMGGAGSRWGRSCKKHAGRH